MQSFVRLHTFRDFSDFFVILRKFPVLTFLGNNQFQTPLGPPGAVPHGTPRVRTVLPPPHYPGTHYPTTGRYVWLHGYTSGLSGSPRVHQAPSRFNVSAMYPVHSGKTRKMAKMSDFHEKWVKWVTFSINFCAKSTTFPRYDHFSWKCDPFSGKLSIFHEIWVK